jgi:hypothetical protein
VGTGVVEALCVGAHRHWVLPLLRTPATGLDAGFRILIVTTNRRFHKISSKLKSLPNRDFIIVCVQTSVPVALSWKFEGRITFLGHGGDGDKRSTH